MQSLIADISYVPLPAESFNQIISTEVVEYFADERKYFQSIFFHLKPGGIALVSAPFLAIKENNQSEKKRLTIEYIEDICQEIGFCIVESKLIGSVPTILADHIWSVSPKGLLSRVLINKLLLEPLVFFMSLLKGTSYSGSVVILRKE